MKLSIITVNLNNASGLRRTIDSVLAQTSRDFEYIIIDGGSTDESVEIIRISTSIQPGVYTERSKEHPISYWVSEPDQGIYNAMNKGIRIAKGEYCQFLNSGDWLVSHDVIEKMLGSLPDCSIYYGNMIKIISNDKNYRDISSAGNISLITFIKGTINHSPTLIRKSLFEKYGLYDETMKIAADWKFFLIAIGLHDEKVAYINLDVSWFEMSGISNREKNLLEQERSHVINSVLPKTILKDYLEFTSDTIMMKKLKQIGIVWWFVRQLYRISIIRERLLTK